MNDQAIIASIEADQVLDSRGLPTVQVRVSLENGSHGWAEMANGMVPSGARSKTEELAFDDWRADSAVELVRTRVVPALVGMDAFDQAAIDAALNQLDPSENWDHLGVNVVYPTSLAVLKAASSAAGVPVYVWMSVLTERSELFVPTPMFSMISGGVWGLGGNLDFRDYLLIPYTTVTYAESLLAMGRIYWQLRGYVHREQLHHSLAETGGISMVAMTNDEVLDILKQATMRAGYRWGNDIKVGIHVDADQLYTKHGYLVKENLEPIDVAAWSDYFARLLRRHPLYYVADPFVNDDLAGWRQMMDDFGSQMLVAKYGWEKKYQARLQKDIQDVLLNALVLKPSVIGTVSELMTLVEDMRARGIPLILAQRSGETMDTVVADLAVGLGVEYVQFGAPAKGERVAKYNRLLEIYRELM